MSWDKESDEAFLEHLRAVARGQRSAGFWRAPVVEDEIQPKENARAKVLRQAEELVNGDRNASYGDPIQDFARTAVFWQEYLQGVVAKRGSLELQPHDVAAMMALLKISRLAWSPEKEDSWVDLAGYAACGFDCVERQDG